MKHLTLLACFAFFTTVLPAQDLHIYYNTQNETLRYEMDGQTVSRPKVRRGSNVFLHIENFNNYVYLANVETDSRDIATLPSGKGVAELITGLGKNGNSLLAALEENTSRGVAGTLTFASPTTRAAEKGEVAAFNNNSGLSSAAFNELLDMMKRFENSVVKLRTLDTLLQRQQQELRLVLEAHQIRAVVMQEIEALKYDLQLTPDQIKRISKEYLEKVLDAKSPEEFNLNTLLAKGDTRGKLTRKLEEVKNQHIACNQEIAVMSQIKEVVDLYNAPERKPELRALTSPLVKAFTQVQDQDFDARYIRLEKDIDATIREMPETDVLKLTAMWRAYEGLTTNTFSRTYRTIAKGDQISLVVKLDPTEAARTRTTPTALQMTPIEVPVYGGFKINASVGVAFGQLFERPQSFFVRDSLIKSEDKDRFFPIVTSFFHFYGQTAGNVSFGGSFGVGVPIGSTASVQSISFFAGPSLIIGRGERIVLSGGLMGTRVERLAQGFEIGDTFRSAVNNVPTKQVYELGYFLGLSFNVLGSNR